MPERKRRRIPSLGWVVTAAVVLPVVYWMSAPLTLWAWKNRPARPRTAHSTTASLFHSGIPEWWRRAYSPVLRIAEHPALRRFTMPPFEWGGVDGKVEIELLNREFERKLRDGWLGRDESREAPSSNPVPYPKSSP